MVTGISGRTFDRAGGPEANRARPELELLLCCARVTPGPEHVERLRALCARGLDWPAVLRAARVHSLTPLLAKHVTEMCASSVPPGLVDELRVHYEANGIRNRFLTVRLHALLDRLASVGIRAIALKGPALTVALYGDLALRRFADLDILVRREDATECRRQLLAHGFRPYADLPAAREDAYLDTEYEYDLVSDGGRVVVGIHWDIVPRAFSFRLDQERLWKFARPMSLEGYPVLVPAPEDLLMILSVHGSKHLWRRLRWICDVAELIRAHPDLDWGQLLAGARARGGERMLLLGLCLAAELLEAPLPPAACDRLAADPTVRRLARRIEGWLAAGTAPPPRSLAALRFTVAMRERAADRARHVLRVVLTPTPKDWASVRLPRALAFLYYALRPLRLATVYGRQALRSSSPHR